MPRPRILAGAWRELLRGEGTPQAVVDMPRRDMVVHAGHVVAADGELL